MLSDIIFRFFLSFSGSFAIISLVTCGYIWSNRKIFYHTICIMLLAALFNAVLKVTFKVPLNPSFNKDWYAFPSGHMQFAFVLYVWLALHFKSLKRIVWPSVFVILTGIFFGLVHFGYHNYFDVFGALISGSCFIIFYKFLLRIKNEDALCIIIFALSSIFMTYLYFAFRIESHFLVSYYALIGILIAHRAFGNASMADLTRNQQIRAKTFATLMCFSFIFCVIQISNLKFFEQIPIAILQLRWMLVSFVIPFSCYLVIMLKKIKALPKRA